MTSKISKSALGTGLAVLLTVSATTALLSGRGAKADAPAAPQECSALIVPGKSIGKVHKGMTTNEVEAALGKPERWQGKVMIYDKALGMSVLVHPKTGVSVVFCGDEMLTYPGFKTFKGRTKDGVGMESSRDDVIAKFGFPTKVEATDIDRERMEYKPLGLTFTLESDKVIGLIVDFRSAK